MPAFKLLALSIASSALIAGSALAANPSHVYLMDNASDALGGPALVTQGGSFAGGQYSFGVNQGFSVSGAVPASVYTLDFSFSFDTTSGYRRLVEFKNLGADAGLYNLNSALNFYPVVTGPAAAFAANVPARVSLSRDAAGWVTGYVNGVRQFSFDDTSVQHAVFSAPGQIAWFFRDDNAVGNEASAGRVDYLQVFDRALSAAEVAALTSPVPEPASSVLALCGLAALATWRRRQSLAGR